MRIGISTSVIQRGRTGVAQYLFALLGAFTRHSHEHQFTLFVLKEDAPLFGFARGLMKIVPVPENWRPPARNILWHQFELPRLAAAYELDVLHSPSYRRMVWKAPCSRVATIHDLAPFHVGGKYDWKRMFYGRVVARHLARRQEEIIAVSENTAKDIAHFFRIPDDRLSVIHNGLDHERFHPGSRGTARETVSRHFNLTQPFFLYVARLEHPAKNHVRLVQAFSQFKQAVDSHWQLVLGGSDWHGAPAIHEAIRHSPFRDDIRAIGFVPPEILPDLYRAAEAFVYPSLFEGFGMPPTEAMACACPVLSSTRGALGEIVRDAAVLIDPENIGSMTNALVRVAMEVDLREKLRVKGLLRAREFNWQNTAQQTLKVYERAVARIASRRNALAGKAALNAGNEYPRVESPAHLGSRE